MREEAIAEYHRLLAEDPTLNSETFMRLRQEMIRNHLAYGTRPLGISLRPHFLVREQYERLVRFSEAIARVFEKVAEALVETPSLMERVRLRESERKLALVDPGFRFAAVNARLDAFLHNDEIKFVEYNAENPSSLPDQSGLNRLLSSLDAFASFSEHYRLTEFDPVAALLTALVETYREWGGTGAPRIAILDWPDLPTEPEFRYLRDYFKERGCPAIICEPDELEYTEGRLRCGEFQIDLVYKRVVIHELLAHAEDSHPLLRAYRNHHVCLVNPFRCKIVHKKAAFELLTDEEFDGWFSASEREVINESVPWTRSLHERKTKRRGRVVDLIEHVRKNRDDFILKPNDDYGGRGIFLGKNVEQREWEEALTLALADGDYVVQEALEIKTEVFPVFDPERWSLEPVFVDTNPFIFRGRVQGVMVRLSDSPIVNVSSGGGETGFFVIEGRR